MKWNTLTKAQQAGARRLHTTLGEAGIATSVTQVATNLADVQAWHAGTIDLGTLCARTGWTQPDQQPATTTAADRTTEAAHAAVHANAALRAAILADRADGIGANEIARRAGGAMSRQTVFNVLSINDLRTAAAAALADWPSTDYELTNTATAVRIGLGFGLEEDSRLARMNAAGSLLNCLRSAGIGASRTGEMDLPRYLATEEGSTVVLHRREA